MRKLGLWYTRNFKPIMTHDELEPIMATLGFVALPSSAAAAWKEYVYCAGAGGWPPTEAPPPRPRLPYPRIDGLHIYTYTAFLEALDFYLHMNNISDLFHIRSVRPPFPSLPYSPIPVFHSFFYDSCWMMNHGYSQIDSFLSSQFDETPGMLTWVLSLCLFGFQENSNSQN